MNVTGPIYEILMRLNYEVTIFYKQCMITGSLVSVFCSNVISIIKQKRFICTGGAMNMQHQQGSTLVEVIIAMFILALIIVGLNAGVLTLIKSNLASKELSAATSSAYSLFENLNMISYSSITTNRDTMNNKYIRAWTVTTSADTSQKTINITVYWPVTVQSHRISLSTIIARP